MRIVGGLLSLVLAGPALADPCVAPTTVDDLLAATDEVARALADGDSPRAAAAGARIEADLPCLDEVLPAPIAGYVYRAVGVSAWVDGAPDRGRPWLVASKEQDPTYVFGIDELDPGHPLRTEWKALGDEAVRAPEAVAGAELVEGRFWLDGRPLARPEARPDRPHLLQAGGEPVRTWVIDGNTFPAEVLAVPEVATAPPDTRRPSRNAHVFRELPAGAVVVKGDPAKWPLIASGAAALAGAGGLYLASTVQRGQFDGASDIAELDATKRTTNQLFLASTAAFLAGGGALGVGIALPGREVLTPSASVGGRF